MDPSIYQERTMSEEHRKDHEPWSPRLDNAPLFINSADYERALGKIQDSMGDEISEEVPGEDVEQVPSGSLSPVV
jgi:hypothetical protein